MIVVRLSRTGHLALAVSAVALVVVGVCLRPYIVSESERPELALTALEIGFIQDMGSHHEQALFMVDRLDVDVAPVVWRLGRQIDSAQRSELGMLRGWLRLLNVPMANATPMSWMTSQGSTNSTPHRHNSVTAQAPGGATMPGMATWAELNALGRSRGAEAEVMFLRLMLRHHQGGVAMAQDFTEQHRSGPVYQAARAMIQDQGQEIGLLSLLLEQRNAEPLPYP